MQYIYKCCMYRTTVKKITVVILNHNMKYLDENIIDGMQTHMGVEQRRGDDEAVDGQAERGEG